ncbi:hypothetical protein [Plebeiibacterium sediminum]|uniref:Uncharacterized protein n=1 Tax=Plebeiibacterium sediminum TaxID=2992112 RepID=A0AAE3SHG2_9BACT|nr:hypothetical protein [Plebeiobacterium sediminum]MCW3789376.1 hypothetical protein [Plebeiobacterium sediminum]
MNRIIAYCLICISLNSCCQNKRVFKYYDKVKVSFNMRPEVLFENVEFNTTELDYLSKEKSIRIIFEIDIEKEVINDIYLKYYLPKLEEYPCQVDSLFEKKELEICYSIHEKLNLNMLSYMTLNVKLKENLILRKGQKPILLLPCEFTNKYYKPIGSDI